MTYRTCVTTCLAIIACTASLIFYQLKDLADVQTAPSILCTTTIIADVVKNIGNDSVKVFCLMGPDVDPHLYKPVESDILKIKTADIIFYNGLDLEAKMADLFANLAHEQTTIAVTKDIPATKLITVNQFHAIFDPHVWFDITLWSCAVQTICTAMIEKFPEYAQLYQKNCDAYLAQLEQTLAKINNILDQIPKHRKILITGHDAFSYFARLHNFQVVAVQGISTESSPGAYDMQALTQLICDKNIPAIFLENAIPAKNIIALQQAVAAQGKQVKVGGHLYADALGNSNSAGNSYLNMMLANAITLANALTI